MNYLTMSWEERQRMVKEFERRIEAGRQRAVSSAELANREAMDAALHGAPVEALELERATADGMPEGNRSTVASAPRAAFARIRRSMNANTYRAMTGGVASEPPAPLGTVEPYEDRIHEFGPGRAARAVRVDGPSDYRSDGTPYPDGTVRTVDRFTGANGG